MPKTLYKILKDAVNKWENYVRNEYKNECLLNCFDYNLSKEEIEYLLNYIEKIKSLHAGNDCIEIEK